MCLIAFAIGTDPAQPLLLAANRDEFFERPTEPLHRWALPDGTGVVAGRDLRDGGTWLGMSEAGRVAMLTNVRSANPGPGRRSRGELTTRWLQSGNSWDALLSGVTAADYGGFNLVVGDLASGFWAWVSNRDPAQPHEEQTDRLHHRRLAPGVYGLSNAALDTPWPKTLRLKQALDRASRQGRARRRRWWPRWPTATPARRPNCPTPACPSSWSARCPAPSSTWPNAATAPAAACC